MGHLLGTDAERLVQTLDQEIRSRGHGAIRAVDRVGGYTVGWWQNRAKSGDITVHQLLMVLDHLGLNPASFMRRTLGPDDGIQADGLELDRPRGEPPEIVAKAWARVRLGAEGTCVGAGFLDTLDQQRYQEPEEVVRLALWAVDHVELDLLPRLLGIAGSAWRLMILLEEAEHVIHAGVEIAQQFGDRPVVGNLLQRLSYVVADRGDRKEALRLAEKAALIFLRCGDRFELGKALVAQGIWLHYLARDAEAIETLNYALNKLSSGPSRPRCAALQTMGLARQKLGDLNVALENVRAAQEASVSNEEWAQGKLLWLRARIQVDLGELDQAARHFGEVVEIFRELHPGETALAACELVRVQLLLGRPEAAHQTTIAMYILLEPVRHNKIVSAALGDLLRSGQKGLTLALVKRSITRIEGERQRRQSWRSLRVRSAR